MNYPFISHFVYMYTSDIRKISDVSGGAMEWFSAKKSTF